MKPEYEFLIGIIAVFLFWVTVFLFAKFLIWQDKKKLPLYLKIGGKYNWSGSSIYTINDNIVVVIYKWK